MDERLFHFVETHIFTKRIDKLASAEVLFDLQNELLANPKLGSVIQGTNGLRKGRIGDRLRNQGKSGGFRYIYLYLEKAETIYLLMFYGKNEKSDLTAAEKKVLSEMVNGIKETYEEQL